MSHEDNRTLAVAVMVGTAVAFVAGSFLPWATARSGIVSISRNGVDGGGDGWLFFIAALVLLFLAWRVRVVERPDVIAVVGMFVAGLALMLCLLGWRSVDERISTLDASAEIGSGLYLIGFAAVVCTLVCAQFAWRTTMLPADTA